jgi:hypothetical protein
MLEAGVVEIRDVTRVDANQRSYRTKVLATAGSGDDAIEAAPAVSAAPDPALKGWPGR